MKTKLLSISCALLCAVSTFALDFNRVHINLTNQANSATDGVYFVEAEGYTSAFEDSHDEVKGFVGGKVFIYGTTDYGKQSAVFNASVEGEFVGYKNNTDAAATLRISFDEFVGTINYYLKDLQDGTMIPIVAGQTYDFAVEANQEEAKRFQICNPSAPTICHQYGNLIITGHVGEKVKVLDMDGEVAIAEQTIDTDSKVIELTSLTSGEQYQVIVGDKTMIIRVQ